MERNIRIFSQFGELSDDKKLRFSDFEKFNDFLERNPLIDYTKLYTSYIKVILGEEKPESYDEIDFQIKYLIEVTKIPINLILVFAQYKFGGVKDIFREFFEYIPTIYQGEADDLAEKILIAKSGEIILVFYGVNESECKAYKIPFNIYEKPEDILKMLKESLSEIDFTHMKEGKIIDMEVLIR